MTITGVTVADIRAAAEECDVRVYELNSLSPNRHRFQLKPGCDRDKYKRTSRSAFNQSRRVWALCWHGHRDFMRALFRLKPNAVIRTSIATYKGSEHFEEVHVQTQFNQMGAPVCPLQYADLCDCQYTR